MSQLRSFPRNLPILLATIVVVAFASAATSAAAPSLKALLASAEENLQRGDLATANEEFRKALQLAQESHDLNSQAAARNGLARVLRDPFEAPAHLRLALSLHRQLHDVAGEAMDLFTLGESYQLRGYLDKALQVLTEALAIERQKGLHGEEARTLTQLAIIQRMRGSYEEALFDFEAALDASRRSTESPSDAIALETQLGILYSDLGRYQEAEEHLKSATEAARRLRSKTFSDLWAELRRRMAEEEEAFLAGKSHQFIPPGQGYQPPDPAAIKEADPQLFRAEIEVLAEDFAAQGHRFEDAEQVLATLDPKVGSGVDILSDRKFQPLWQSWLNSQSEMLADMKKRWPDLPEDPVHDSLVDGTASLDRSAMSQSRLSSLPENVYAEQAHQLSTLLQAGGYKTRVTGQEIAKAVNKNKDDAPMPLLSHQEQVQGAFSGQASVFRRVADGTATAAEKEQVAMQIAVISQARNMSLGPSQSIKTKVFAGLTPSQIEGFKNYSTVVGCEAESLSALSRIYRLFGSDDAAQSTSEEAWKLAAELPKLGREEVLESARKRGLPVPSSSSRCSSSLFPGSAPDLWASDLKVAEGQMEEAYQGYVSAALEAPAARPAAWARIGALYAAQGKEERALGYYRKAIDATEAMQGLMHLDALVASWASHQEPLYAQVIRLLYDLKQPAQAFEYAERARARAFLDQVGNQRLPEGTVSPELASALQNVRQRLFEIESFRASAGGLSGAMSQTVDRKREEEEALKLYERLLAQAARTNSEYSSLVKVDVASLEQVQADLLDTDSTLLEYFVLDDRTLVWIIDRDRVRWLALPVSAKDLRLQIDRLRNLVKREPEAEDAASSLHDLLFAPLEAELRHSNLIIVPHGPLHSLPFGALRSRSRGRYLVEDYTISMAPSASVLRFVLGKRKSETAALLALGNPDGSLPFAETEVQTITKLFGGTALTGKDAKESRLYIEAERAGILHLAAHASLAPGHPLFSRINLAEDGSVTPSSERGDGRLHVYEIYDLHLTKANLVVLSACDTAQGSLDEGDNLVSLQRAFIYAGAPAVLSTLWEIDDSSTAALMEGFYRRFRRGEPAAEALRAAQRDLLRQAPWRAPYFWAALTLTGYGKISTVSQRGAK